MVKLKEHLKGQHNSIKGDFLDFNKQPTNCKWVNWKEYLTDPKIILIEKEGMKLKRGGNPRATGLKTKVLIYH